MDDSVNNSTTLTQIDLPHTRLIVNTVSITNFKFNEKTSDSGISLQSSTHVKVCEKVITSKQEEEQYFDIWLDKDIPYVDSKFTVDWLHTERIMSGLDYILQACYEDRYGKFYVSLSPKLSSRRCTYKYGRGGWVNGRSRHTIKGTEIEVKSTEASQPQEMLSFITADSNKQKQVQNISSTTAEKTVEELISEAIKEIDDSEVNNMFFNNEKLLYVIKKVQSDWKITIFLSSPFDGCEDERELFMQQYVPQLTRLCMEKGVVLCVVDMRWGITQEMVNSDRTLLACLSEVDKSDIFLGYFGARYGSSTLEAKNQNWINKSVDVCINQNNPLFSFLDMFRNRSITEMEWLHAFLHGNNDTNAFKPMSFFLYRSAEYDASKESEARLHTDAETQLRAAHYRIENAESAEAATRLRELVKAKCAPSETDRCKGYLIEDYKNPRVAAAIMNHICVRLITRVQQNLVIKCSTACIPHMIYTRKKLSFFEDFGNYVSTGNSFTLRNDRGSSPLLALFGPSGSGKSSIMAGIVQRFWNDEPKFDSRDNFLIYYFVGCNSISTAFPNFIRQLYDEFSNYLSVTFPQEKKTLFPFDTYDLNDVFPKMIECFTTLGRKPCRLIIIIAAINELVDDPYNVHNDIPSMLKWLPLTFPPRMKVVVSCANDDTVGACNSTRVMFSHLRSRVVDKEVEFLEVEPFDEEQRRDVVEMWHRRFSKTVDELMMAPVWKCDMCSNPCFLSFVMKDLVLYGSWATLTKKENNIRDKLLSAKSLSELIMIIIEQVEIRTSKDTGRSGTVKAVLMYIFCSREGLSIAELTDLITQDRKLVDSTSSSFPALGPGFWITLVSHAMEHLLDSRQGLYNFSHDSIRQAVEKAYFGEGKFIDDLLNDKEALGKARKIKSEIHHRLALYFKAVGDADESPTSEDTRARREKIFQESHGGKRPAVVAASRLRPMNSKEKCAQANRVIVIMRGKKTMLMNPKSLKDDIFTLDLALNSSDVDSKEYCSQEQVYHLCGEDVVRQILDGVNVSVLAYGPTGTGKSYTMFGTDDAPGLIPRILKALFVRLDVMQKQQLWSWQMQCTMVEVHLDKYRDLLNDGQVITVTIEDHITEGKRVKLKGAISSSVTSIMDINVILSTGTKIRATSSTSMNDQSSRSHCILTIYAYQQYISNCLICRESKLHLVDLAGNEKGYQRGKCCAKTQQEASTINADLAALNACIRALTSSTKSKLHIPYRGSKLTWLLQDSLGGNSRLVLLATVSPAESNYWGTKSTLAYASQSKKIPTGLIRNKDDEFLREEAKRVREAEYRNGARREFLDNVSVVRTQSCPKCEYVWAQPLNSHNVTCEVLFGGCGAEFCFLCAVSKDVIAVHGAGYHRVSCEFRTECCADKCLEMGLASCCKAQYLPDQCSSCKAVCGLCTLPQALTEYQICRGFTLLSMRDLEMGT